MQGAEAERVLITAQSFGLSPRMLFVALRIVFVVGIYNIEGKLDM